jgi:cell division protein FtsW (lipid II flippase)
MCARHLALDPLYAEDKERIADMNSSLEADSLRRQANTVVRLTVVTIFGLIGTVSTGFLGMNLLAEADAPLPHKLLIFAIVFVLTLMLTVYTMMKSKRLSDFLDALSDEQLSVWQKCKALALVWRTEDR